MLNIEQPNHSTISLHHLGFRPFFLMAGLFAVISITIWLYLYHNPTSFSSLQFSPQRWHAHEMIFGYGLAVIAGFLLTAVRNWTNVQTTHGIPLLLLTACWLFARIFLFIPFPQAVFYGIGFDLLFATWLCFAILTPIIKARQWQQLTIWLTLVLLLFSNVVFYLGYLKIMPHGMHWGLYSGLYIIIALILMMGRRVIPFFIEKGLDENFTPKNYKWVDVLILPLMFGFWLVELSFAIPVLSSAVAALLAFTLSTRCWGWYTPGIWKKPLLWIIYLAYSWITLGFALKAISHVVFINPMLTVHAFAYGGIGLMTLGMMARVALGHTGRNVFDPPQLISWMFYVAVAGSVCRVIMPLLLPDWSVRWVTVSQLLWIFAFALFVWLYAPMLIKPRIDGRYG